MSITISLAVITHNSELFIAKTLDSVLRLLSPPDELLIIDNASSDQTCSIVNDFLPKLSNSIQSVHLLAMEENTFASGGLTVALGKSNSEYLSILHGDDLLVPEYFNLVRDFFENNGDVDILNVALKEFGSVKTTPRIIRPLWTQFDFFNRILVNGLNPGTMPGAVIRRDFFDFDLPFLDLPPINGVEDTILWVSAIRRCAKVRRLDTPVVAYRRHEEQSSNSSRMAFFSGIARRYVIGTASNPLDRLLAFSEVNYEKGLYRDHEADYEEGLRNIKDSSFVKWFRVINVLFRRFAIVINRIERLFRPPARSNQTHLI